jgi:hypothetical protein
MWIWSTLIECVFTLLNLTAHGEWSVGAPAPTLDQSCGIHAKKEVSRGGIEACTHGIEALFGPQSQGEVLRRYVGLKVPIFNNCTR